MVFEGNFSTMADNKNEAMFREISADDEDQMPMSVESLCMKCEETVRDKQFLIKSLKFFMMKTITFTVQVCAQKILGAV